MGNEQVVHEPETCDFPPCSRPASATVRLVVDDDLTELSACPGHVQWLRDYAEQDAAVTHLDEGPATDGLDVEGAASAPTEDGDAVSTGGD